jgi:hypothetical protein
MCTRGASSAGSISEKVVRCCDGVGLRTGDPGSDCSRDTPCRCAGLTSLLPASAAARCAAACAAAAVRSAAAAASSCPAAAAATATCCSSSAFRSRARRWPAARARSAAAWASCGAGQCSNR